MATAVGVSQVLVRELSHCIAMALTYHLNKKNQTKRGQKKT